MLYIFGKRTATIGRFVDHEHICYPCKSFDREILIYRPYFHFCFIPVFPIGSNEYAMRCRNCGDETRLHSVMEKYRSKAKAPFYLYSAWILVICIAIAWFYWNKITTRHKVEYVDKPMTGDIYTIKKEEKDGETYYFLRIVQLSKDSVKILHNHLDYGEFVSSLADDDYFVKDDTLVFKRTELKRMLERDEIYSLDRGYGESRNFEKIK
jgi:hypothetical protein